MTLFSSSLRHLDFSLSSSSVSCYFIMSEQENCLKLSSWLLEVNESKRVALDEWSRNTNSRRKIEDEKKLSIGIGICCSVRYFLLF